MNIRQFLRMAKWARHPPSARRVKLVLAVVAVCLFLVVLEQLFGWPDFLTLERPVRPKFPG